MKKIICSFLLASICMCVLVGCGLFDDFYSVTVTGSKSTLMQEIMPTYRAGTVVKIKAHPVTDASLHVFVNGEEISMNRFDSECWEFEFVMPEEDVTIHLTYDQFYGKDEYYFKELYWHPDDIEQGINKVILETYDSSKENSFIERSETIDEDDIEMFKSLFSQELIKVEDEDISDETVTKRYFYYYNGDLYGEFYFVGEYLWWNDFSSYKIFKFKDENFTLPTIENPKSITYSFKYDGRSSDVKKYGDESFSMRYTMINSAAFVEYDGEVIEAEAIYYLDSRYGKINLLSPTIFELNGVYYQIVSGMSYWAYTYCDLENK